MDTSHYVQMLRITHPLRLPVLRSVIRALELPSESRGLDAGCGIGQPAMLLAETLGPESHVTGVDVSPEFLAHAREIVEEAGFSKQVSFQESDVASLPFEDDSFDWAWSVDCVGYAPMEPLPLVRELARVVKPGGTVALLAWSSEKLLPGYPLLEAHLSATFSGIAPFRKGKSPEAHFLRARGWFRDAGLEEFTARTFAGDACAPLNGDIRDALIALFGMRWTDVEPELTEEEWVEYQRLCLPGSPDFILNHPDYYVFFTYSLFQGRVAG